MATSVVWSSWFDMKLNLLPLEYPMTIIKLIDGIISWLKDRDSSSKKPQLTKLININWNFIKKETALRNF